MPGQMVEAITGQFQSKNPNPQNVADAIVYLINTERGERPLRTVVDQITGEYIKAANQAVAAQFENGMKIFANGGKDQTIFETVQEVFQPIHSLPSTRVLTFSPIR